LKVVSGPPSGTEAPGGAIFLPDGQLAVHTPNEAAFEAALGKDRRNAFVQQSLERMDSGGGNSKELQRPELMCHICRQYLKNATAVPCCFQSFCDECIRQALLADADFKCPFCNSNVDIAALRPNPQLQRKVDEFLVSQGIDPSTHRAFSAANASAPVSSAPPPVHSSSSSIIGGQSMPATAAAAQGAPGPNRSAQVRSPQAEPMRPAPQQAANPASLALSSQDASHAQSDLKGEPLQVADDASKSGAPNDGRFPARGPPPPHSGYRSGGNGAHPPYAMNGHNPRYDGPSRDQWNAPPAHVPYGMPAPTAGYYGAPAPPHMPYGADPSAYGGGYMPPGPYMNMYPPAGYPPPHMGYDPRYGPPPAHGGYPPGAPDAARSANRGHRSRSGSPRRDGSSRDRDRPRSRERERDRDRPASSSSRDDKRREPHSGSSDRKRSSRDEESRSRDKPRDRDQRESSHRDKDRDSSSRRR